MAQREADLLKALFTEARSQNGWRSNVVSEDQLKAAYDLAKWGPTSMNSQPMRIVFVRSNQAKERLMPSLAPGNIEKVMTAPVIAIIAYDIDFASHLPRTFPHNANAKMVFEGKDVLIEETAFRNSSLQGAYLMLALRAQGLDVGPMSGFDSAKLDAEFFSGTSYKSNFLCGIGRGEPSKVFSRLPRLPFEEMCSTL